MLLLLLLLHLEVNERIRLHIPGWLTVCTVVVSCVQVPERTGSKSHLLLERPSAAISASARVGSAKQTACTDDDDDDDDGRQQCEWCDCPVLNTHSFKRAAECSSRWVGLVVPFHLSTAAAAIGAKCVKRIQVGIKRNLLFETLFLRVLYC